MRFLHLQHDVFAKGTALWQTKTGYRKIAFVAYVATACLLFLEDVMRLAVPAGCRC